MSCPIVREVRLRSQFLPSRVLAHASAASRGQWPAGLPPKSEARLGIAHEKAWARHAQRPLGNGRCSGNDGLGLFSRPTPFRKPLIAELVERGATAWDFGRLSRVRARPLLRLLEEAHIQTGKPICYTSADSVFQIAAHEEHLDWTDLPSADRRDWSINGMWGE